MKWFIALSTVVLLNIISDYSCHANVTAARNTSVYEYSSDEELVKKRASGTNVEVRLVAVDGSKVRTIPEGGYLTQILITLKEMISAGPRAQQCSLGNTEEMKVEIVIGGQTLDIPLDNVPAGALDGEDVNFQTLFSGVTDELSEDEKIDLANLTWLKLADVVELLNNPDLEIQKLFKDNGYLNGKVAQLLGRLVNERLVTKQAKSEAGKMKLDLDDKTKEAVELAVNVAKEIKKKQELEDQLTSVSNNLDASKKAEARLQHDKKVLEAGGVKTKAELDEVNKELKGKLLKIEELEKTNKALEAKVNTMSSQISSMSGQLADLRKSLEAETTGKKNAEEDVKKKEAALEKIKTELAAVRKERTDIQGKADQLERNLSEQAAQSRYAAEEMWKKAEEEKKKADEDFGKKIAAKEKKLVEAKQATKEVKAELEQEIAQLNYDWERQKNLLELQLSSVTEAVKEITKAFEAEKKINKILQAKIKRLQEKLAAVDGSKTVNKCHCFWRQLAIMRGYLNPLKEGGLVRQVLGVFLNTIGLGKRLPMTAAMKDDLKGIGEHFDALVKAGKIPAPNLADNEPAAIQNGATVKAGKKPAAAGGKRK